MARGEVNEHARARAFRKWPGERPYGLYWCRYTMLSTSAVLLVHKPPARDLSVQHSEREKEVQAQGRELAQENYGGHVGCLETGQRQHRRATRWTGLRLSLPRWSSAVPAWIITILCWSVGVHGPRFQMSLDSVVDTRPALLRLQSMVERWCKHAILIHEINQSGDGNW